MKTNTLRCMTETDLPGADELRRLAGWNQTVGDWRRVLRLEPEGCFVALEGNAVIGTATTTTYGSMLAWIGMMLVHPDHRRRGIGTALIGRALEYLQGRGVKCVKLDATPAGRPLYEKLGFIPESTLTRCERPANSRAGLSTHAPADTRGLEDGDWDAVEAIDAAAFGAPRRRLLRSLGLESRAALVWPKADRIRGWGMLRPGANAAYLGPAVCASSDGCSCLVEGLLHAADRHPVIWDVPDGIELAGSAAERFGFVAVRPLTRMRLGPELGPRDNVAPFAIAGPALG